MAGFTISKIHLPLARDMASMGNFWLDEFFESAKPGSYYVWTHYNHLYNIVSEVKWGTQAPGRTRTQFHRIHTACALCGKTPERNSAGIGSILLVKEQIPGRAAMICFEHRNKYAEFRKGEPTRQKKQAIPINQQLSLFS